MCVSLLDLGLVTRSLSVFHLRWCFQPTRNERSSVDVTHSGFFLCLEHDVLAATCAAISSSNRSFSFVSVVAAVPPPVRVYPAIVFAVPSMPPNQLSP